MFTSFFSAPVSGSTYSLVRLMGGESASANTSTDSAGSLVQMQLAASPHPSKPTELEMGVVSAPASEIPRSILNELSSEAGRAEFTRWLFSVADADESGAVSLVELGAVLDALAADGLDVHSLTPYFSDTSQPMDMAATILATFDYSDTGTLSETEFAELGGLIAAEFLSQREWLGPSLRRVGPYSLGRTLGYGGQGLVKLAMRDGQSSPVAMKIIARGSIAQMNRVDAEIAAMVEVSGISGVLRLVEVLESETHVFMVLELAGGGTLHDFTAHTDISEEVARFFFRSVCGTVAAAHARGVAHRDIRMENVLLSSSGVPLLADWGHSAKFREGWDLFDDPPGTVGSLLSASPEMLTPRPFSAVKGDSWGLGVLLFTMLARCRPFSGSTCDEVANNIKEFKMAPLPSHVSKGARHLLASLLHPDPRRRATPAEALKSPWLRGPSRKVAVAVGILAPMGETREFDDRAEAKAFYQAHWGAIIAVLRAIPKTQISLSGSSGTAVPLSAVGSRACFANGAGDVSVLFRVRVEHHRWESTRFSVVLTDDGLVRCSLLRGTSWSFRRLFLRIVNELKGKYVEKSLELVE